MQETGGGETMLQGRPFEEKMEKLHPERKEEKAADGRDGSWRYARSVSVSPSSSVSIWCECCCCITVCERDAHSVLEA